jgi:outer membrane murein-binding lipoprotein Lpp
VSPDGGRVAFQLERFELTGDDRLEVAGRWFGVRGLRFVRPSLTVQTDEGERSLLALLEHKPWAAEEGDAWVAAFPWKGGSPDPDQAELAVAPSVVVTLAEQAADTAGSGGKTAAPRKKSLRDQLDASEEKVRRLEAEVAFLRQERERFLDDVKAAKADGEQASAALAATERERDDALREQERIAAQRDEAVAMRNEARAERDTALHERDEALHARDAVRAETADSDAIRKKAAREREAALRDRDQAVRERDRLAQERDQAVEARKAAEAARDSAIRERDAALGRATGFPAVSAGDLAREPRAQADALPTVRPSGRRPARGNLPTVRLFRERPPAANQDWLVRGIALAAVITFLLLVLVFLKPL